MKRTATILACLFVILFVTSLPAKTGKTQVHDYIYDYERMSRAAVAMLHAVESFMAENIDIINTHNAVLGKPIPPNQPYNYKGINPEGGASYIGKEFTKRTGMTVKFASE